MTQMISEAEKTASSASAIEAARQRLRIAHEVLAEAEEALGRARELAERAGDFVERMTDERDTYVDLDRDVSLDRAAALKVKLRSGSPLKFEAAPLLSKNAVSLAEATNRLNAAEAAAADLAAEAGEMQGNLNRARDEVRAAALALALSEANAMAEEVEAHEAVALGLRVSLGGSLSPVGQFPVLTEPLKRVLGGTDLLGDRDVFARNGELWNAAKRANEVWRDHVAGLLADPDAELNFDAPEQPMATAAE